MIATDISGWNPVVFAGITQKADFVAVHYGYAPSTSQDGAAVYQSMLAAPEFHRQRFEKLQSDLVNYATAQNLGVPVAETEHGSFFVGDGTSDEATQLQQFIRNQNVASAIYSALYYNVLMSRPEIMMANHINPFSPYWEAPFIVNLPGTGYPATYSPQPVPSAFFNVYKLYQQTGGGTFLPSSISGSPTYSVAAVGTTPALSSIDTLDATVVIPASSSNTVWLYLVNRDLTNTWPFEIAIAGLPPGAKLSVSAQQIYNADYTAMNTQANPSVVTTATVTIPSGGNALVAHLPPVSLTRVAVSY
jgi:hypothetical protein